MNNVNDYSMVGLLTSLPPEQKFSYYQLVAKCLNFSEEIKVPSITQPLEDWEYDECSDEEKGALLRWAGQKKAEKLEKLFFDKANGWIGRAKGKGKDYRAVLLEIVKHLKLEAPESSRSDAEVERSIMDGLLRKMLEQIEKMPQREQDKMEVDLRKHLTNAGHDLGSTSAIVYLKQGGVALGGAWAASSVATGLILANLGVWNSALLAVGLYAAPAFAIGAAVFAPLMLSIVAYHVGKHSYKATIPCVILMAQMRAELLRDIEDSSNKNN